MKTNRILWVAAIAAMAAPACQTVEMELVQGAPTGAAPREFSALVTKTALSEGNVVVWQGDEHISVFDGAANNDYSIKSCDGASAVFTGSVVDVPTYWAVYPYAADNAYDGDVTLTATVPVQQTITSGSFAPGAAVVVGRSTQDYVFPFQNAVALLKVKLGTGMDGASRIEVSGNNGEAVAGAFTATYGSDAFTFADAASGTSTTVSLDIAGGTFEADKFYYIAIRPQNFSKGITARVYFPQGGGAPDKIAVKTSSAAINLPAGSILPLGTFTGESVWAPSLGYGDYEVFTLGDVKYISFNYGESKSFPVANVASLDDSNIANGWSASYDATLSTVTVTAPANDGGNYPPSPLGLKLVSPENNEGTPVLNVRLYGIGSVEELQMADHIMQAESGFTVPAGTPAGTIDSYLVTNANNVEELFLTADLTLGTDDLRSNAIAMHHNQYPLNGNNRTVTFDNVVVAAWPTGFIQNMQHDVHDLCLAGAITSTYTGSSTRPQIGALAARAVTNDVIVTNVSSSVDITYDATSSPAFIGGLVGLMSTGNKSITFKGCSVTGDIVCNAEITALGGIIAQGEGSGSDANAWTTFEDCLWQGTITYRPDATLTDIESSSLLRTRIGGIIGNTERQLRAIRTYSRGRIDVYLDNKIFGSSANDRAIGGWFGRSTAYNSNQPQYHMAFYIDDVRSSTHIYVHGVNANEVRSAFQIRGFGLCARSGPGAENNGNIILENSAAIHFEDFPAPAINGSGSAVSFAYGESQNITVTTEDLSDWTVAPVAPAGWNVDVAHIKDAAPYITVTAPARSAIQAGTAAGAGNIAFTLTNTSYGSAPAAGSGQPVRLYGINSKEEFMAFRTGYGASANKPNTSFDGIGQYLVNGVLVLNSDLSFETSDLATHFLVKFLDLPLDGNNRTITYDFESSQAICSMTQGLHADVSNLNFDGTIQFTGNSGECAFLSGRGVNITSSTVTAASFGSKVTLTNVNVLPTAKIIVTGTTANNSKLIGGLVASATYSTANVTLEINNCTVAGTIENSNSSPKGLGGFIGVVGSGVDPLVSINNSTFDGTIKFRYVANSNNVRIGGFIGDQSRQASITNCALGSNAELQVYMNNNSIASASNGIGGFVGRTTASTGQYTMSTIISNFTYNGKVTVYDATSNAYIGTGIGCDAGYEVTRVDGVQPLTGANPYNFPGTALLTATQ